MTPSARTPKGITPVNTSNTCGCGRPTPDALLCAECRGTLAIDLTALAAYIPELGNAVALRARTSSRQDNRPPVLPAAAAGDAAVRLLPPHLRTASGPIALRATSLGLNLDAAQWLGVARTVISTWCRRICHTRKIPLIAIAAEIPGADFGTRATHATADARAETARRRPQPTDAVDQPSIDQRMLAWLLRNITVIAQVEAAWQIAGDLRWLRQRIETVIDNAQPRVFAGTCNATSARSEIIDGAVYVTPTVCGHTLLADPEAEKVTCESCGAEYDVADRQADMLEHMRHSLMRAPHIVDVLRAYNVDITLERLKNWIARDRAEFDEARRRTVAYPPILMASATELDEHGQPYLEQDLDPDGTPRLNQHGRPILRLARGKPLYRLGDVQDRVLALKEITASRSARETA